MLTTEVLRVLGQIRKSVEDPLNLLPVLVLDRNGLDLALARSLLRPLDPKHQRPIFNMLVVGTDAENRIVVLRRVLLPFVGDHLYHLAYWRGTPCIRTAP